MSDRILVLGAGFGGLELATVLSEAFGDDAGVTLIDGGEAFVFGYSKLDLMFGHTTPGGVRLPYSDFAKPGIRFLKETITAIDPHARRVTTDAGVHDAEVVVVALGADYDFDATPGLAEAGNEFYSVGGAERVREVLPTFRSGRAIVGVCGAPFKCPPAPSEEPHSGLAGYGALRLGEVRGLQWRDVSFEENTISVSRSLLPDGVVKGTKSEAGKRTVALFPELRRLLRMWQIKSPCTAPEDYIVCAVRGVPVMERNLRRALDAAKSAAGIDGGEKRLSWHSLRHSAGSIWLTEHGQEITTVSAMMGHTNPAFTLRCYGRDPRDEQTMVADVLKRAARLQRADET